MLNVRYNNKVNQKKKKKFAENGIEQKMYNNVFNKLYV